MLFEQIQWICLHHFRRESIPGNLVNWFNLSQTSPWPGRKPAIKQDRSNGIWISYACSINQSINQSINLRLLAAWQNAGQEYTINIIYIATGRIFIECLTRSATWRIHLEITKRRVQKYANADWGFSKQDWQLHGIYDCHSYEVSSYSTIRYDTIR